ncbi:ATP-dependent DNA helicase RecG [Candidatus Cyrtobacter comes]|uniref:ATP-dependent DNA helicase RecG n=1 Tax=Candidatus Cyrtobacter comes TaxID=675776 RepID=A0ABU5L776_9RICK|nr:ATP-dependent DNA helicase RecG [Candidatus Cyrtobacter comes]MDZ5761978.1 ATP-dependent DNA helicase RecG [Candidatus Cyrtobacter comes]
MSFFIKKYLDTPVIYVKGVGPFRAKLLNSIGCKNIRDLLFYMPIRFIDRTRILKVNEATNNAICTFHLTIHEIKTGRSPLKILCYDGSAYISLVYFNSKTLDVKELFKQGNEVFVSGRVILDKYGDLQIHHPDIVSKNFKDVAIIEPIYKSHPKLTSRAISNIMRKLVMQLPNFPGLQDQLHWHKSMQLIHNPQNSIDFQLISKAKERIAFEEVLCERLLTRIAKSTTIKKNTLSFTGKITEKFIKNLPFKLTADQEKTLSEISADQGSAKFMFRLLQGDVGSGKTIIMFAAALNCIEAGMQVAIMVPTEILAKQHFNNAQNYLNSLGIKVTLLVSAMKKKEKDMALESVASVEPNIIIGTHALLNASFKNLGLVIIDEQHRFGVNQRVSLIAQSASQDVLLVSATPIPRTLNMTLHKDIDVSQIITLPCGRKKINTIAVSSKKIDAIIKNLKNVIDRGEKIYWVCPLIEESEIIKASSAELRFNELKNIFKHHVNFLHGRMHSKDKDAVMESFMNDDSINILVSTTVIEIGVDVKNATVMVIENAERFGLAQLHQLRGRVGRSDLQSTCILIYDSSCSISSVERLKFLEKSTDGFELAKLDMQNRGSGRLIGFEQSGEIEFKAFKLYEHLHLIEHITMEADRIIEENDMPKLDMLLSIYTEHSKNFNDIIRC